MIFNKLKYVALMVGLSFSSLSLGDLNDALLYRKCYGIITSLEMSRSDPRYVALKSGQGRLEDACLEVLELALLDSSSGRLQSNNGVSRSILRTFHNLHHSWLGAKEFLGSNPAGNLLTYNVYDVSSAALHLTRALFEPEGRAKHVFTRNAAINPIRMNSDRAVPVAGFPVTETIFQTLDFMKVGYLIGMTNSTPRPAPWADGNNSGVYYFGKSYGGGVLGTPVYLQTSLPNVPEKADGGVNMPRTWARDFFKEFMCRDLPLLRASDYQSYVDASSPIPFRANANCVGCHTSMDQFAGLIRHLEFKNRGGNRPRVGTRMISPIPQTEAHRNIFPTQPDENFSKRPPKGRLFYRSYNGKRVNYLAEDLNDMANKIVEENDYYVCMASRYYEMFNGVKVNLNDIQSISLNEEQARQRNEVIALGEDLKTHQNFRRLIKAIVAGSEFKASKP